MSVTASSASSAGIDTESAAVSGDRAAPASTGRSSAAGRRSPMRTGLATVCISGTLEDKLAAAAAAGFDGVEIFEPDFLASSLSAAEVRRRCADLGLAIDLYQPFRDFDSVRPDQLERNLRRADRKFDVMAQMGVDLLLVCSSVSADAVDDEAHLVEQFGRLADLAAERGMRISYEALAWGTHVNTYPQTWDVVRTVDSPALGLCLDSFHILSRGSDPAGIRDILGDKIFFLQLADAPALQMDVLQWSRHYRLFPGQGNFDLAGFVGAVLAAGYRGPLSLEVFNDVFRQSDPTQSALDALRSLLVLQEQVVSAPGTGSTALPTVPDLGGFGFVELTVDEPDVPTVAGVLGGLGFQRTGMHRSKPVDLWQTGDARVLINHATARPDGDAGRAAVAAIGIDTADPRRTIARAQALLAPVLPRTRGPAEAELSAVAAPDGTEIFACPPAEPAGWLHDFLPADPTRSPDPTAPNSTPTAGGDGIQAIDHVALTRPFDRFDEAALFYRAILGLRTAHTSEVAAPFGLVRNRALADPSAEVRICLSVSVLRRGNDWRPGVTDPQHVAFRTDDVLAVARAAAAAGAPILQIPANYYDDLDARLALPSGQLSALREVNVLFDRNSAGDFLHFYTDVLGGRLFFEVVQRVGDYQGYGEANAPIRMAAHRRQRARHSSSMS